MLFLIAILGVSNGDNLLLKPEWNSSTNSLIAQQIISRAFFSLGTECGIWTSTSANQFDAANISATATSCLIKSLLINVNSLQKQDKSRVCNSSLSQFFSLSRMAILDTNQSSVQDLLLNFLGRHLTLNQITLLRLLFRSRRDSAMIQTDLADCGWNASTFPHDHNGLPISGDISQLHLPDSIVFGRNLHGNHKIAPYTCAIAFGGANDEQDFEDIFAFQKYYGDAAKIPELDEIQIEFGNFTSTVSGLSHDVFHAFLREYQNTKRTFSFYSWLTLANSSRCQHLVMTGYSMGASIAQIHRIDWGDVNALGKYTKTCLGGKSCSLISFFGAGAFWYGRVPEMNEFSKNDRLIVKDRDKAQLMMPLGFESMSEPIKDSFRRAGVHSLVDIKDVQILWRVQNWHLINGTFVPKVKVYQVPRNMPFMEWAHSSTFLDQLMYMNSWGPLVSRGVCVMPGAGTILNVFASYCDHASFDLLFFGSLHFLIEDEVVNDESFDEIQIPDLSSTVFSTIMWAAWNAR